MPRSSTMLITLALLLALCLPLPAQGTAAAAALVTIDAGAVQGVAPSPDSPVRVYRGIPFARPPVGPLRWQPPQPVQPWQGIRDCTEFGPSCPQPPARIVPEIQGAKSEDCLYLNVWTAASPGDNRPVLVWIHGGGFSIGSGAQRFYDGTHFAENGAVLVTINYRLGPFGFLAHPALSAESPQNASGNFGLLDQIAALTWVRHNIAAFGGDPDRVTIFGESAGGMSVGFLLASPLASGLFHRAILQSGVPGAGSPLRDTTGPNPSAEATGIAVARELGIPDPASDSPQTAARLRDVPAETLLETTNPRVGLFGKGRRLWPVVDGHVLPRPPDHLFARGVYNHVPVLLGSNADEGTLFLRQLPIQRPAGYQLLVRTLFRDDAETVLSMFPVASPEEIPRAPGGVLVTPVRDEGGRRIERFRAENGLSYDVRVQNRYGAAFSLAPGQAVELVRDADKEGQAALMVLVPIDLDAPE